MVGLIGLDDDCIAMGFRLLYILTFLALDLLLRKLIFMALDHFYYCCDFGG